MGFSGITTACQSPGSSCSRLLLYPFLGGELAGEGGVHRARVLVVWGRGSQNLHAGLPVL